MGGAEKRTRQRGDGPRATTRWPMGARTSRSLAIAAAAALALTGCLPESSGDGNGSGNGGGGEAGGAGSGPMAGEMSGNGGANAGDGGANAGGGVGQGGSVGQGGEVGAGGGAGGVGGLGEGGEVGDGGQVAMGEGPNCPRGPVSARLEAVCAYLTECAMTNCAYLGDRCRTTIAEDCEALGENVALATELTNVACEYTTCGPIIGLASAQNEALATQCRDGAGVSTCAGPGVEPPPPGARVGPECQGETAQDQCGEVCEWLDRCATRPHCPPDDWNIDLCTRFCSQAARPIAELFCERITCEQGLGLFEDRFRVTVPVCAED